MSIVRCDVFYFTNWIDDRNFKRKQHNHSDHTLKVNFLAQKYQTKTNRGQLSVLIKTVGLYHLTEFISNFIKKIEKYLLARERLEIDLITIGRSP